ncbi:MAG: recombinase family protein [Chloroflexi bacterium]|nr:recombinase family protein [Chloroflexota bacterium]
MTDYAIARNLERMGIPTPGASCPIYRNRLRAAGLWSDATVRQILTRETYAGVARFGRLGPYRKGVKREVRPLEQQFAIEVTPIVRRDVWDAAQARREHNKRISGTKRYLLRGLIVCDCGRKMAGNAFTPDHYRYRCNSSTTYIPGVDGDKSDCHEKTVNGAVIEAVVWDYVLNILTDRVRFEAEWRKAQQAEQDNLAPKQARLEAVNELIAHCLQEAAEIAAALKQARGLVLTNLQASMDSIDDRYTKLTAERERLLTELKTGSRLNDEALEQALQFRADVIDGLKGPTFDDKRLYLELLQVGVTIKGGRAVVRCVLPLEPEKVDLSDSKLTSIPFKV